MKYNVKQLFISHEINKPDKKIYIKCSLEIVHYVHNVVNTMNYIICQLSIHKTINM